MRRYRVSVLDYSGNCYATIVTGDDIIVYTNAMSFGSSATITTADGFCVTGLVTSIMLLVQAPAANAEGM